MRRVGYRGRLFLFLLSFALVPAIALSLVWAEAGQLSFRLIGNSAAWDSIAGSGNRAIAAARRTPLNTSARAAPTDLETKLQQNLSLSHRAAYIFSNLAPALGVASVIVIALLTFLALNVAGHLSRALSRPLQELIGWTELIGRGDPLPAGPPRRGAPEFELLRQRMRTMAEELKLGRARALEAERGAALRESARQVAHELKNPLTPIRFAVDRLRREVPPHLAETVDVLVVESARLEAMAKSFAQFGRLPEGPRAPVDLAELARYTARSVVPPDMPVTLDIVESPMVDGHYDALARALSNVMLNAVDACGADGSLTIRVAPTTCHGSSAVELSVRDTGCGIAAEALGRIWDPYVTTKPGGTGLGLAIVRQTILAHDGAVAADSQPGVGTTIRMILPARSPDSHSTTPPHDAPRRCRPPQIPRRFTPPDDREAMIV